MAEALHLARQAKASAVGYQDDDDDDEDDDDGDDDDDYDDNDDDDALHLAKHSQPSAGGQLICKENREQYSGAHCDH